MKIATWNVNSLTVRLPQVLAWLDQHSIDILCIQELKQVNEKFPRDAFQELGYDAVWTGQKTYNGVAILSRSSLENVIVNNPLYPDTQQRLITATCQTSEGPLRVICAYCPNGSAVDSEKYNYKLEWYAALNEFVQAQMKLFPNLAICGDYNIAPEDRDVHAKYTGDILISPKERAALQALSGLGLTDSFRMFDQEEKLFSWWDYRMMGFRRNAGLRIDHILLTASLAEHCTGCVIDKAPRSNEQPSDHAPVVASLSLSFA